MFRILLLILLFLFSSCSDVSTTVSDDEKTDEDVVPDEFGDFDDSDIDGSEDDSSDADIDSIEMCGPDLTKEEWETEEWKKADEDEDGIPNGYECKECPCANIDGDDSPNYLDEDSEGDGIPDSVECPEYTEENGCRDTDGDQWPDYFDRDSDNDGVSDKYEYVNYATDPYKKDTDGDGDDDLTEIFCNETDPLDAEDHSIFPTICSNGCSQGNSVKRELTFNVGPREQMDITFLIDATSSMEDYVENVKLEITELINEKFLQINEGTEDISYGLIEFPYNVILPQTKDAEIFKTKVSEHGFEESWELHLETIYQSLIGNGFHSKIGISGFSVQFEDIYFPEKDCEGELGDIGGACLRENADHILIILSDMEIIEIASDNGSNDIGNYAWKNGYPEGSNIDDVISAAKNNDAKFIQISPSSVPNEIEYSLLEETLSQNEAGDVLYFDSLDPENGKLSDDIVAAINSLLEYEEMDLKMELTLPDSSENYDKYKVDCSMNVSFKTLRADPEEGIDKMDGTTFYGVKKGTEVTYEINFDDISCFISDWYEDHSVKTYYLYPKLKSGDKVVSTKVIPVRVYPVKCE